MVLSERRQRNGGSRGGGGWGAVKGLISEIVARLCTWTSLGRAFEKNKSCLYILFKWLQRFNLFSFNLIFC